jgi:RNA-binding protein YhbY
MRGTIEDAVRLVKSKPMSTIGKAKMEGVVGRPLVELKDRLGKRVIIKVKVNDFE